MRPPSLSTSPKLRLCISIKDEIVDYSGRNSPAISFGSGSSIQHVRYWAGCRHTEACLQQTSMQRVVILASQHPVTDQTPGMRTVVTRLEDTADKNSWGQSRPGLVTRLTHTALHIK